jgi:hypothetical protein
MIACRLHPEYAHLRIGVGPWHVIGHRLVRLAKRLAPTPHPAALDVVCN